MRFRIYLLGILFCLAAVTTKAQAEQESFPFLAAITKNDVNVRAGMSVNFEKLCQLNKGDQVVVLERTLNWYKIKLPIAAGSYVSQKYIHSLDGKTGEVMVNNLNVRAGPGDQYSVLGRLSKGAKVYFVSVKNGWWRIEPPLEGSYGWVSKDFLSFKSRDVSAYKDPTALARENTSSPDKKAVSPDSATPVKSVGYLTLLPAEQSPFGYGLKLDDKITCYLVGMENIFSEFKDSKVTVEGVVKQPAGKEVALPIIDVSQIELIL